MELEKGYHCKISSWENDADNRKTETIVLQTKEAAMKLKEFLSVAMKAGCNDQLPAEFGGGPCFGNGRKHDEDQLQEIFDHYLGGTELDGWDASELVHELVGYWEAMGYRVFESITCFHVPEALSFESIKL